LSIHQSSEKLKLGIDLIEKKKRRQLPGSTTVSVTTSLMTYSYCHLLQEVNCTSQIVSQHSDDW